MYKTSIKSRRWLAAGVFATVAALGSMGLSGCERKEKVVDIETPGGDVEVTRNIDTGEVEVETTRD